MSGLNQQQKDAVNLTEGPLLILAGAGSGKTRVLTHRIANILNKKLAYPENLLAVTFTNKAASEMKERISRLITKSSGKVYLPYMGTFHSVCVRILKSHGQEIGIDSAFSIYDTSDQLSAVKDAMRALHLDTKELNPKVVLKLISDAKNELIEPEDYHEFSYGNLGEAVNLVYPKYQNILKANMALDFDDLLGKTVKLFRTSPKILEHYQNLFSYILVDEYQDTNHCQYVLITELSKKSRNLCVVGDDDQSIYSWRGATVKNILTFEKDYPEAKIIKLEQNYRSSKNILSAAHEVIKKNPSRKSKKLWTDKNEGDKVLVYNAYDEKDEAAFITKSIRSLAKNEDYNNFSVLYRTHAQSRNLEESFLNEGIPYFIFGGTSFYERKEIKDILAYLRIIHNPVDDISLLRIINVPSRKIGNTTITTLKNLASEKGVSIIKLLSQSNSNLESIRNKNVFEFSRLLKKIIAFAKDNPVSELISFVLSQSGYLEILGEKTEESISRIENIQELQTVSRKFDHQEPLESLAEFLDEISLIEIQQVKAERERKSNRVTLMSVHSAKGLEYDNVFIAGLEEGIFPHSRSFSDPEQMEEERRLAYVGMTRAKEKLVLTHAESRRFFGSLQNNLVSRFIEDIPEHLRQEESWDGNTEDDDEDSSAFDWNEDDDKGSKFQDSSSRKGASIDKGFGENLDVEFEIGDQVYHDHFGKGVVIGKDNDLLRINFGPYQGTKQLSSVYANLEKVG